MEANKSLVGRILMWVLSILSAIVLVAICAMLVYRFVHGVDNEEPKLEKVKIAQCIVKYNEKTYLLDRYEYNLSDSVLLVARDDVSDSIIYDSIPFTNELRKLKRFKKDDSFKINVDDGVTQVFKITNTDRDFKLYDENASNKSAPFFENSITIKYSKDEWWPYAGQSDTQTDRPLLKGNGVSQYIPISRVKKEHFKVDTIENGHKAIKFENSFVSDKKLYVKFAVTDSVEGKELRVYEERDNTVLKREENSEHVGYFSLDIKNLEPTAKEPIEPIQSYRFRFSVKDGMSYCASVNEIPTIDVVSVKFGNVETNWISLCIGLVRNFVDKWFWWLLGGLIFLLVVLLGGLSFLLVMKFRNNRESEKGEDEDDEDEEGEGLAVDVDLREELKKLRRELDRKEKECTKLQDDMDAEVQKRENKINQEADKKIREERRKVEAAEKRADEADRRSREIEERLETKYSKEINDLKDDIDDKREQIKSYKEELSLTGRALENTKNALENANRTIEKKELALKSFNEKITDVQPAGSYAKKIERLLELSRRIENSATELFKRDDIDNYLISRYIVRYHSSLSKIDMNQFVVDVLNIANVQFVYNTQPLAKYNQSDEKSFVESMKDYFFTVYLKKYIDVLYVFNETMAGLWHFVDDLELSDVGCFIDYRGELDNIVSDLELKVLSVKIFDIITDNVDLRAEMKELDFDCAVGTICQINNCIVYRRGADKPNEQISVIVKK